MCLGGIALQKLLSYPRSGSTWLRYCIEFLSKKPTGFINSDNLGDAPIYKKIPSIGVVDEDEFSIIIKSHNPDFKPTADFDLIVLVRDYKEAIPRHHKAKIKSELFEMFSSDTVGSKNESVDYLKVIERYDCYEGNKILIYYEDLMTYPKPNILKVKDFLKIDDKYVNVFFQNYLFHKRQGIKAYHSFSMTKGNDLKFHQNKINKQTLANMTNLLKERNNDIFNNYLKRSE